MVPPADAVAIDEPAEAFDNVTEKLSFGSTARSPTTSMVIVWLVWVPVNVSAPEVGPEKSAPLA